MKDEIINVDMNGICVRKMVKSNLICLSDYLKGIDRSNFNFSSAMQSNSVRMKISEIIGERMPLNRNIKFLKSKKYWKTTGARNTKLVWVFEEIFDFIIEYIDKIHKIPNYISYENQFQNLLFSIFKDIDIRCQYKCLSFYIDFYIPLLNIAIEFDERPHKYHDFVDRLRECEIIKELNCKFIRVDIDDELVGLSKIFKEIVSSDVIINELRMRYMLK